MSLNTLQQTLNHMSEARRLQREALRIMQLDARKGVEREAHMMAVNDLNARWAEHNRSFEVGAEWLTKFQMYGRVLPPKGAPK